MNKPHIHADLIKAWADWAQIQEFCGYGRWDDVDKPRWLESDKYRIKPDPFQELKDAWDAGRVIQYRISPKDNGWVNYQKGVTDNLRFSDNIEQYRIKPHKWQHIFDAWKNGEKIQIRWGEWGDLRSYKDSDTIYSFFQENREYRIKPKEIVLERRVYLLRASSECTLYEESNCPNVRFIFNPDTRELESVELIK